MKRYLIILTLYLCAVVPTMAQYYSVNYDKRTVEARSYPSARGNMADFSQTCPSISYRKRCRSGGLDQYWL